MKKLTFSITRAAAEFGVSRETVRRGLTRNGTTGDTFTILEIHEALAGDLRADRQRLLQAQTVKLERENEEVAEGVRQQMEGVIQENLLTPLRSALVALPKRMAYALRDAKPEDFQRLIEGEVNAVLARLREGLPAKISGVRK